MKALPKLKYEAEAIIPMEHTKPSPRIAVAVDTMVYEAWNEGITQPQETIHMRLKKEIQQGNLRLHELENERVWLKEKSALMDAEVKKMEDEIKEEFLTENTRMVRQGAYDHADKFEHYHCELVSLLPWLRPHITKLSDQGSTLQVVKWTMPTTTMEGGDSLQTMVEDRMDLHIGGATT